MSGKGETSPVFSIDSKVYASLQKDLLKALYFQRCGCALTKEYAGAYTHEACHTSPAILYEDYATHTENPQTFDMTGGWHDAGDFGRYTTPGAVAVGHLLYAYELFPESFRNSLNIPESGNGMPDVLNECLYELRWLMKMQFPDGSVSRKLTAYCHADFIMPEEDHDPFLIYPVSSMAAADFAAVMALASRVYAPFLPDFAKEALEKAKKSFDWLLENPYIGFHNPEGSNTGEYDDDCDMDERMWAAAELLRSDHDSIPAYREELQKYVDSDINKTDFGWTDVSGFALLSVLTDPAHTAGDKIDQAATIIVCRNGKTSCRNGGKRLFPCHETRGFLLGQQHGGMQPFHAFHSGCTCVERRTERAIYTGCFGAASLSSRTQCPECQLCDRSW